MTTSDQTWKPSLEYKFKKQACKPCEHFIFGANAAIQCSATNSKPIKICAKISTSCKTALYIKSWIQK